MRDARTVLAEAVQMLRPGSREGLIEAMHRASSLRPLHFPEALQQDFMSLMQHVSWDWRRAWTSDHERRLHLEQVISSLDGDGSLRVLLALKRLYAKLEAPEPE